MTSILQNSEAKRNTRDAALAYRAAGISVLPIRSHVDPDKRTKGPVGKWKHLQSVLASPDEVSRWFDGTRHGVGTITGEVSGNLEAIDFDEVGLVDKWAKLVEAEAPGLLARLTRHTTPRDGAHVLYRCETIEGNAKLAMQPTADGIDVRIETRGEGGYVVAPGSPAECHKTGRLYEHHSGPRLADVQTITPEERDILFSVARSFDLRPEPEERTTTTPEYKGTFSSTLQATDGQRPGDAFNQSASWQEVLGPAGWVELFTTAEGLTHWQRPGKDDRSTAATTGTKSQAGNDLFVVFSTNAYPFEAHSGSKTYSRFDAYATLKHGGDLSAAAKDLYAQGFGERATADDFADEPDTDEPTTCPGLSFVSKQSLTDLGIGTDTVAGQTVRTIPERNAAGETVGTMRFLTDARQDGTTQRRADGSIPGIYYADNWQASEGPIYVVSGAIEQASASTLGLCAIGLSGDRGKPDFVAELLESTGRPVVVFGTDKPVNTAKRLAERLMRSVQYVADFEAANFAEWLGGKSIEPEACRAAGFYLATGLAGKCETEQPPLPVPVWKYVKDERPVIGPTDCHKALERSRCDAVGVNVDLALAGSGKSHADIVNAIRLGSSLTEVPTHKAAAELAKEFDNLGALAICYPERNKKTCPAVDKANACQNAGMSPSAAVCPYCPFKDDCDFKKQTLAAECADHSISTQARGEHRLEAMSLQKVACGTTKKGETKYETRPRAFISIHEDPRNLLAPMTRIAVEDLYGVVELCGRAVRMENDAAMARVKDGEAAAFEPSRPVTDDQRAKSRQAAERRSDDVRTKLGWLIDEIETLDEEDPLRFELTQQSNELRDDLAVINNGRRRRRRVVDTGLDPDMIDFMQAMSDKADDMQILCSQSDESVEVVETTPAVEVPGELDKKLWNAFEMLKRNGAGGFTLDGDAVRLLKDICAGEITSWSVVVGTDKGATVKSIVAVRKTELPEDAVVIIADATSDVETIRRLVGRDVTDITPGGRLEAKHRCVQIPFDITGGMGTGTVAAAIIAAMELAPGKTFGVISHKCHIDAIFRAKNSLLNADQLGRVTKSDHFFGTMSRASNSWKDECDILLVVGTPRIPEMAIREELVRMGVTPKGLGGWGPVFWEQIDEDGEIQQTKCNVNHDLDWRSVHESIVKAELVQAIGRGRSITDDGIPVFVLSNEPTGATIASQATIRDFKAANEKSGLTIKRRELPIAVEAIESRGDEVTRATVADELDVSESTATRWLEAAVEAGSLVRSLCITPYIVYLRTDAEHRTSEHKGGIAVEQVVSDLISAGKLATAVAIAAVLGLGRSRASELIKQAHDAGHIVKHDRRQSGYILPEHVPPVPEPEPVSNQEEWEFLDVGGDLEPPEVSPLDVIFEDSCQPSEYEPRLANRRRYTWPGVELRAEPDPGEPIENWINQFDGVPSGPEYEIACMSPG